MLTRRSFLKRSTAVGAVLAFPSILRSASPNSNLQVVVCGCKGQGMSDLAQIGSHAKVKFVGFCDVDSARFDDALKKFPGVATFGNYREMFEKLGTGFDAIQVSTPDHWHAPIALDAMRLGKHVYCQKPLTHTVWEARQMRAAADKSKVITQMGNQIHSASEYRTGVQWIRGGAIGKIKEVHSWQSNHGNQFTKLAERPKDKVEQPPKSLNWEMWLGPAPVRDYVPGIYAPFTWRDWQDFGGGTLGDFGCHILDPVFSALDLNAPLTILAENEEPHPETWPKAETITYEFPGNSFTAGDRLVVKWYDGGRQPDASLSQMPSDKKLPGSGSLFIGENGTMVLPHVGKPSLYRAGEAVKDHPPTVPGANHYHVWVDAVLANERTTDGFHYSGPLAETVQLGNLATRIPGKKLDWNAEAMKFPNYPDAEKLLTKEYRKGYEARPV